MLSVSSIKHSNNWTMRMNSLSCFYHRTREPPSTHNNSTLQIFPVIV